jgi:hypothetical protein
LIVNETGTWIIGANTGRAASAAADHAAAAIRVFDALLFEAGAHPASSIETGQSVAAFVRVATHPVWPRASAAGPVGTTAEMVAAAWIQLLARSAFWHARNRAATPVAFTPAAAAFLCVLAGRTVLPTLTDSIAGPRLL